MSVSDASAAPAPEANRIQELLSRLQAIRALPAAEQRAHLARLAPLLAPPPAPADDAQPLLDGLDRALSDFVGDPRRLVACVSELLGALDRSPERASAAVQRFLQERAAPDAAPPSPFDWTMVDILLSQLSRLSGDAAPFTRAMCDSVVFALFRPAAEPHSLQGLVAQILALSTGEAIALVRARMRLLAQAPLSKVTLLSNVLLEIQEKYERELEKIAADGTE
jgi:hypothetical protein